MHDLVNRIGVPAMLEQTAEECSELSFALLKLARLYRGENKVYGHTEEELKRSIEEELADILLCSVELENIVTNRETIFNIYCDKVDRMFERLETLRRMEDLDGEK